MDRNQVLARVAKYLIEGIAVAIVAIVCDASTETAIIIATTAAAVFAVLDVVFPAVCVRPKKQEGSG